MSTRERFLSSATKLFGKKGYHATGLNEIVEISGAPKGSLYHHFPGGKEQLAMEAIRSERAFVHSVLENALNRSPSATVAIQTFILELSEHYSLQFRDLNLQSSHLPMSLLALETAAMSESLRRCCAEAYEDWIDL